MLPDTLKRLEDARMVHVPELHWALDFALDFRDA